MTAADEFPYTDLPAIEIAAVIADKIIHAKAIEDAGKVRAQIDADNV